MATSSDYIDFVCQQIVGAGTVRSKKMFGEYIVYVNDKPILLVCDNTVYVKMLPCVADLLSEAPIAEPYKGAKPHYLLDIDCRDLALQVIEQLEKTIKIPKPKTAKKTK